MAPSTMVPFAPVLGRNHEEPRGQGAQASASRRALVSGVSAVVCVAAVALLASSEGGPAPRGAFAGPAELTASSVWMQKLQKTSAPANNKMFLTAIDAAMAAVQDARGNISPKLAQAKKPVLQVVRAGQQLAEAEPSVAEPAVSEAEPAAEAAAEPAVAAPEAPEGMEPAAAVQGGTPETPPLSAQMFPAVAGPGVVQESYRPGGAMIPVQPPTQIEEAMMPQPGMVPAAQVAPQPGGAYAYAVYPGAKVQVAVTHTEAAPAAPTGDTCVDGKRQSPINIELNVEPAQLPVLAWRLNAPEVIDGIFAPVQEEGQGKWLRVVDAGLSMTVKGADYQLRSLIVHSPSEHTVSGQRYDMELQFLHSTMVGEQQQYLMVSALVNKADASAASPALSGLAAKMQDLETVGQISVNIRELALAVLGQTELVSPTATNAENYFMYDGSFTTSPCTEGVTWVILKNALQASAFDIETLAAALPQTNRPLQAVGQRVVKDRKVLGYAP